ncbi:MAG: hypothetical protein LBJ04_03090 [Sphingobacterium sp.]|jgi:hypothetical protein|nr:hypothetical protein [Sphingobacterium sp.]
MASHKVLGLVQGQKFVSSAVSGLLGSLGAYGWGKLMNNIGLSQFANSPYGIIGFGVLSGGIGSVLSGGNFWQGALVGGVVAGLNHVLHQLDGPVDNQDQYSRKTSKNLTQAEFNEYVKMNREQLEKVAKVMEQAGLLTGAVPTDIAGWKDIVLDVFKGKFSSLTKLINIKTLVGSDLVLTSKEYSDYSEMLNDVKYNYDKLQGNGTGKGIRIDEIRVHVPFNGGVGYTITKFYDIRTNKYLGGGSL